MHNNAVNFWLADSDEDDQYLLTEALKTARPAITLSVFHDGITLLNKLQQGSPIVPRPELMLMDYFLPPTGATTILQSLHDMPLFASVIKIVWCESVNDSLCNQCRHLGAADILTKPIHFTSYKEIVNRLAILHGQLR